MFNIYISLIYFQLNYWLGKQLRKTKKQDRVGASFILHDEANIANNAEKLESVLTN